MQMPLNCAACALLLTLTLSGCATAPSAQECPKAELPPAPAPEPPGPNLQDLMRIFLSGTLPSLVEPK